MYNICNQRGIDNNSCYNALKRLQWAGKESL